MKDFIINNIDDLRAIFPDEKSCIDHLEKVRWGEIIISPFYTNSKVYRCSNNRFKCNASGKYFNVRTKTIFENSNIELIKWFMALYVLKSHKGIISSYKLASEIDVSQHSAWFMLSRLRRDLLDGNIFEINKKKIFKDYNRPKDISKIGSKIKTEKIKKESKEERWVRQLLAGEPIT